MKFSKKFVIESLRQSSRRRSGLLSGFEIMFLHGFGANLHQLRPIGDKLNDKGAGTIYISMRGHGKSIRPAYGYSCIDLAADIHRLLHCYHTPLHMVGYSHGGLVATVSSILFSKEKISSLVIIDESFAAHPNRMIDDAQYEARYLRWMYNWIHLLSFINIPTLILYATESHMITDDELRIIKDLNNPHITLLPIKGTHANCIDNHDEISDLISDFYKKILKGAFAKHG